MSSIEGSAAYYYYSSCRTSLLQLNTGLYGDEYIGNDLNVEPAWLQQITGCNVTVSIVDDGSFI